MKKTIITALVAIVGIAFIGAPVTTKAQTAATTTAPAAPAAAKKEKKSSDYTSYKGKLSALDATSATVTTKKGDLKLAIDASTEFEINKKKATAADFAAGDEVTGSYKANADGSMTAHSLHKKAAK